jgi:hypothetical protein
MSVTVIKWVWEFSVDLGLVPTLQVPEEPAGSIQSFTIGLDVKPQFRYILVALQPESTSNGVREADDYPRSKQPVCLQRLE